MKLNFLYNYKLLAINFIQLNKLTQEKFCLFFSDNMNLENTLFND